MNLRRYALLGLSGLSTLIAFLLAWPVLTGAWGWLNGQIGNDGLRLVVAGFFVYLAGVCCVLSKRFK